MFANEVSIYYVVAFNVLVQGMLIWRLKFPAGGKWKYVVATAAIPVLVLLSMRLAIALEMMPLRVADQTPTQQTITTIAGLLLIGAPWVVTLLAVFSKKRRQALKDWISNGLRPS